MPYALFRLSVTPKKQIDLFQDAIVKRNPHEEEFEKTSYLRKVFRSPTHFTHYTQPYVLSPLDIEDDFVSGFIAKGLAIPLRSAPGTKPTDVADWAHSNFFLSFKQDSSSHIFAGEINRRVGSPGSILRSFLEHINSNSKGSAYDIISVPVGNKDDYLHAARKFRGHITEVRFTFVVPNIKFLPSDLREVLTESRDEDNAQEVEHAVKNKDGNVNAESERLVGLAQEAEKGIGTIIMKWARRVIFRSSRKVRTIDTAFRKSVVDADKSELRVAAREIFDQWEP